MTELLNLLSSLFNLHRQDHPFFVDLSVVIVVIGVVLLHDFVLMYVVDLMQERRDRERRRSLVHPRD